MINLPPDTWESKCLFYSSETSKFLGKEGFQLLWKLCLTYEYTGQKVLCVSEEERGKYEKLVVWIYTCYVLFSILQDFTHGIPTVLFL